MKKTPKQKFVRLALFFLLVLSASSVPGLSLLGSNAKALQRQQKPNMLHDRYTCTSSAATHDDDVDNALRLGGSSSSLSSSPSFYVRNECGNGSYLVIKQRRDNRRVVAVEGVTKNDPIVEIVKESCLETGLKVTGAPVYTRLFHPASNRYVCFSRKGRVKTVSRHAVDQRGDLCLFIESVVEAGAPFVTYTSAHNPGWLLGFNGQRLHGGARLARPMLRKDKHGRLQPRRVRPGRCDFLFTTGVYEAVPTPPAHEADWAGVEAFAEDIGNQILRQQLAEAEKKYINEKRRSNLNNNNRVAGSGDKDDIRGSSSGKSVSSPPRKHSSVGSAAGGDRKMRKKKKQRGSERLRSKKRLLHHKSKQQHTRRLQRGGEKKISGIGSIASVNNSYSNKHIDRLVPATRQSKALRKRYHTKDGVKRLRPLEQQTRQQQRLQAGSLGDASDALGGRSKSPRRRRTRWRKKAPMSLQSSSQRSKKQQQELSKMRKKKQERVMEDEPAST